MIALREAWPLIEARVRAAPALAIGTDFDGTLAPLEDRPEAVRLPPRARAALERLAGAPGVTLAVVSGRSLGDIESRLELPRAVVIGNHGWEVRLPGGRVRSGCGAADLDAVRAAAGAVAAAVAGVPGVWMEDKGATAALHVRQASREAAREALAAARAAIARLPARPRLVEGNDVLEIRPPGRAVDKGRALVSALAEAGAPPDAILFYFGDDATDEDAFNALPPEAVTVRVGGASAGSAARYAVASPEDVVEILGRLGQIALRQS